jgi:hypothetical protein
VYLFIYLFIYSFRSQLSVHLNKSYNSLIIFPDIFIRLFSVSYIHIIPIVYHIYIYIYTIICIYIYSYTYLFRSQLSYGGRKFSFSPFAHPYSVSYIHIHLYNYMYIYIYSYTYLYRSQLSYGGRKYSFSPITHPYSVSYIHVHLYNYMYIYIYSYTYLYRSQLSQGCRKYTFSPFAHPYSVSYIHTHLYNYMYIWLYVYMYLYIYIHINIYSGLNYPMVAGNLVSLLLPIPIVYFISMWKPDDFDFTITQLGIEKVINMDIYIYKFMCTWYYFYVCIYIWLRFHDHTAWHRKGNKYGHMYL